MNTQRSLFTEAIEDHLALKKQNGALESAMPLARYDLGDPLERFPGGPGRAADGIDTVVVADETDVRMPSPDAFTPPAAPSAHDGLFAGPSPEQAMEAASALEHGLADRPFEPLGGMTPMLSLVEDIDEDESVETPAAYDADVLRFPGGVGPREDEGALISEPASFADFASTELDAGDTMIADAPLHASATATLEPELLASDEYHADAPTGEQPVLVIDTDEPLAPIATEPLAPSRESRKRPRFFGLGRKKDRNEQPADGWFTDGPRDFNWD